MSRRRETVTTALLVLAPLGLGLLGSLAADWAFAVMPYLYGQVDVSLLPIFVGLLGSLIAGGQVGHRLWMRRRERKRF